MAESTHALVADRRRKWLAAGGAAMAVLTGWSATAAEINVMASVAVKDAYIELVPEFEKASQHKVVTEWVPTAVMMTRLKAGESPDLVIMSSTGIDALIKDGKFSAGSRIDIAKSGIGVAIKKGAAKPDLTSAEAVKQALKSAKSVAYSTGPSGVYLAGLFEKMGLTAELAPKLKVVQGEPVAAVVARGDAEIGFQQVPELLPAPGIDYLGTLPADIQQITVFSGGSPTGAKQVDAAKALVAFLKTTAAAAAFKKTGMDPG
jgi:molybdate transport system substrate-binding protein